MDTVDPNNNKEPVPNFTCKQKFFLIIHWLGVLAITIVAISSNVNMHQWNMRRFCDDSRFHETMIEVDTKWPYFTIVIVSATVILLLSLKMYLLEASSKDVLNIINYFMGFILSADLCYLLKNWVALPIPSFFLNDQIYQFYCVNNDTDSVMPPELRIIDSESRDSFPSFVTCALCYATVFVFLLSCYLDKDQRLAARFLALLAPGSVSLIYGWSLVQFSNNHAEDVLAGATIGSFIALYIFLYQIRDLTSVDYETLDEIEELNPEDTTFMEILYPNGESIDMVELQPMSSDNRTNTPPPNYDYVV